jgi:steroid delta-isomerase-like uncharacterized protein
MTMSQQEMWRAFQEHARGEHPQDLQLTMETVHEEAVFEDVATGTVLRGKDEIRRYYEETFRALPGWTFTRHAVHATDEHIISEVTIHAVHCGPWHGVEATGREVRLRTCVIFSFKDGKVLGERSYYDRLDLLRQLGAVK